MIDTHVHVYSLDEVTYPRLNVKTQPPPEPAEAEDYLRVAGKNSISKAVLVQPTFYGTDTRYIFHVASKYPDTILINSRCKLNFSPLNSTVISEYIPDNISFNILYIILASTNKNIAIIKHTPKY